MPGNKVICESLNLFMNNLGRCFDEYPDAVLQWDPSALGSIPFGDTNNPPEVHFYKVLVTYPNEGPFTYDEIILPVHKASKRWWSVGTISAMEIAANQLKTAEGREQFLTGIVHAARSRQAAQEAKRRTVWDRLNDEDKSL